MTREELKGELEGLIQDAFDDEHGFNWPHVATARETGILAVFDTLQRERDSLLEAAKFALELAEEKVDGHLAPLGSVPIMLLRKAIESTT